MAELGRGEGATDTLKSLFEKGFSSHIDIEDFTESTNSKGFQDNVQKTIQTLEEATRMVNKLSLFSKNEQVDEVSTPDLKYLLLPALLGGLTLKKISDDRLETIKAAEVYFLDFLQRCKSYGLTDIEVPYPKEDSEESDKGNKPPDLISLGMKRQEKIARYREQKELEAKQKELKELIESPNVDDEIVREYNIVLIKFWINKALEEIQSIQVEKPILKHMAKLKSEGKDVQKQAPPPRRPFKPVIITRDELQKKVYGIGYPSIPTMTVDEFYKQRYPEHEQKPQLKPALNSLQGWAIDPEAAAKEEEKEDAEKEKKIEEDDEITLRHARDFEDWRDENRRGCGNRKNMG